MGIENDFRFGSGVWYAGGGGGGGAVKILPARYMGPGTYYAIVGAGGTAIFLVLVSIARLFTNVITDSSVYKNNE